MDVYRLILEKLRLDFSLFEKVRFGDFDEFLTNFSEMTQNVSFFHFSVSRCFDRFCVWNRPPDRLGSSDFVCKSGFTHKLKKCKYERKKFLKVDFGEEIVNS